MRLVTYLSLVLRRVWARRLMLLGSFLGATLVTALLVVLPLYEASVSAVDLLFTFRQAPDTSVDLTAVQSFTEYSESGADSARATIDRAAGPVSEWYPTVEERVLSREFVFIPIGSPDWLASAEEWRNAGADPEATPWPAQPPEATQARIFTTADLHGRIEVFEGELRDDQDPLLSADPILEVVLGEDLASLTQLGVGDRVVLRAFASLPDAFEVVEVGGIARATDPEGIIWDGVDPDRLIYLSSDVFNAWSGTFSLSDPQVDPWLRTDRGFRRINASQTFTLHLDREAVALENVQDLARGVTGFTRAVAQSEGIRTISQLPGIVEEFDVRTVVFGAPIVAMLALVVAGALYFLIYMAALALERESSEIALLRMRGASAWQTVGIHLTQSAVIALGAMALAPMVARGMVALTGRIPPMSTLTGGEALTVSQARSVVPFVLTGGVLTFVAMGLAILPLARRSVLELRALASRPVRQSVWQRYYLDIFLVVLAAVVLYELRQRGLVDTATDDLGLDPFSVAAPALFLFSGALFLLRILPWVLRGIGWLMTRFRGMSAALPGWHLGRNPIPYGRLALLVWLTTGFGAFALTYADTLETSYDDRASYAAGADVRLIGDEVGYLSTPEGAIATPVYRSLGAARLTSRVAELLAVRPSDFPEVVAWRSDYGDLALIGEEGLGPATDWGVEIPEGATAVKAEGILRPRSWAAQVAGDEKDPVRLMMRFVDDRGRFRLHAADVSFDDLEWRVAAVDLSGAGAINGPFDAAESLVIQAVWMERDGTSGGAALDETRLFVADVWADGPAGTTSLLLDFDAEFDAFNGLQAAYQPGDTVVNEYFRELPEGEAAPSTAEMRAHPLYRDTELLTLSATSRTRAQAVPHLALSPDPLRFVLDTEAAGIAGLAPGDTALFGVDAEQIEGVVAGIVDLVPTTGDPRYSGVLITSLDGLIQWVSGSPPWSLTGTLGRWTEPTELWVATSDANQAIDTLTAELGETPDEVLSAAGVASDFSSRPIQVGLVSILFIGTGAGVLLTLAGVTGYVLVAVRRRYREMGVLRALGLRRRGVAGTFALEQLVVLGIGALIGIGAGIGLMRLMIPFLQLGEDAGELLPPAVMQLDFGRLALYLGLVALVLVTSVLWSTRSVSSRRLSEVLREVER